MGTRSCSSKIELGVMGMINIIECKWFELMKRGYYLREQGRGCKN